ncbi:hypothetical protein HD600_000325 [Microbacterium ginsengiterrae]|uniref:DUF4064 domain-containing protein n=1 Tax=Microbacterium ginsengiterrae TaxID=546115 RepID=A0A7W9CAD9_9MICO|nr:hypothetical protein [Microbacterium ginsengiterrae]MBB5741828.1 hypothetical protein [Microbacterium ginsengiterrae]
MTEPQFPPPPPYGAVPPVPPAQGGEAAPAYQSRPPVPGPQYYANPPGAYAAPVGGYSAPSGAYQLTAPAPKRGRVLGVVAFVLAIVAAVVAPIVGGAAGYSIGFELPSVMERLDASTSDLSFLSPVRDQVLMGEISFWLGTLAGIAAIVLGIMAIVKRAGRAFGITGLVIAVVGPIIFFIVLGVSLTLGAADGSGSI